MSLNFILNKHRVHPCRMYGGAGGYGTRISSSRAALHYRSSWQFYHDNGFIFYEKALMQNLNDRLASYVQTSGSLENKNAVLERKIEEWYATHSVETHDYSKHMTIIKSIEDKINQVSVSIGVIDKNIENTRLAAEDFKSKYEIELILRKGIERDSIWVRKEMDELTLTRSNLEMEYERLREERIILEKNYKEDKAVILAQSVGQMDICINAAPSTDLKLILIRIREEYEAVAERNVKDLEVWFQSKFSNFKKKFFEQSEELEANTKKLKKLRSDFNKMEIELQSQCCTMMSLKDSLQESLTMYAAKQAEVQEFITELEIKLRDINAKKIRKQKEYENLQTEIKKYKSLLELKDSDNEVSQKAVTVVNVVETCQTVTKY